MSVNAYSNVDELSAEALAGFDVDGAAPWYASKRTWIAALIAVVLAGEITLLARNRDPLAAERRAVAALDDSEKARLEANWQRFESFKPAERERVRELHAAMETDAKPDALRAAMASYQEWKAGLSPQQGAALVGLSPQKRIEAVRKFAREQEALAAKTLSNEDAKIILAWLEKQVEVVHDKLFDALPADARERLEHANRRERNWSMIMSIVSFRGSSNRIDLLSPQAVDELRDQLTPAAKKAFDAAPNPEARKQLLADWIRQATYRMMSYRDGGYASRVDDKELQRYLDELPEPERARYLALPREEMASQLRREYMRRNGLWKEPSIGGYGRPPFNRGPGQGPPGAPGGGGMGGPGGQGERRAPFSNGLPNGPPRDERSPDDMRQPGRPGGPGEPRNEFRPNDVRPAPGPNDPRPNPPPGPPKSTA